MKQFILLNPQDNVAVAVKLLLKNEILRVNETDITILDDIPPGHKVAVGNMREGDAVIKYGFPIGHATVAISVGEHVHIHNVTSE